MSRLSSDLQPKNALSPIFVTFFGMDTLFKLTQPINVASLISVIRSERMTLSRLVHPVNAQTSMNSTESGIVI